MRRIAIGLSATIGIVVLLLGIPAGLYLAGGAPWPNDVPSWDGISRAITSPDDGTAFLILLKVAGWLAWLSLAAMVLVEIASKLRGVQAPSIPALGLQQKAAVGLVGAATLLFSAPLMASALPAEATVAHTASTSSTMTSQAQGAASTDHATPPAAPAKTATRDYTVRTGDSLWSIAENQLGDGARFSEIATLNYGTPQPNGKQLTRSHWIQPNWTLKLPAEAAGTGQHSQVIVETGDSLSEIAQEELRDGTRWPELYEASKTTPQPDGRHLEDPDLILPGWTVTIPGDPILQEVAPPTPQTTKQSNDSPGKTGPESQQTPPHPGQEQGDGPREGERPSEQETPSVDDSAEVGEGADTTVQVASVDSDENEGFPIRTVAGVGALLAAGVLGLVAARRSRQQRRRRPGQTIELPDPEVAAVEQELRATADPLSVQAVDVALRTLAARCAQDGDPLPMVRAARLTAEQFDLYLAEPTTLPEPWEGTQDRTVWTLPTDADGLLSEEAAKDVPAPYPALVTVGHDDEDGHVFLDLEHIGALGLTGDPEHTRQVLAAISIELATSRWADDLQVTIVGAYPELEDNLETGRVRYMPVVGRLMDELAHRAEQDRGQLDTSGMENLNHARVSNTAAGAWTPEIVILSGEVSPNQAAQLEALIDQVPRVAIAAVTHGHVVGEWTIALENAQSGTLEPIGLHLRPQVLDDATYTQILTMLATTDRDLYEGPTDAWPEPEPTLGSLPTEGSDDDQDVSFDSGLISAEHPLPDDQPSSGTHDSQAHSDALGDDVTIRGLTDVVEPAADPVDLVAAPSSTDLQEPSKQLADNLEPEPAAAAPGISTPPDNDQQTVKVETATNQDAEDSTVRLLSQRGPQILMLGPVEIVGANGTVEASKTARFTELAAFLALNPGCDHNAIDHAQWPGQRVSDNSRNTAMSKLRRWMGRSSKGEDYLPRYQSELGYRFHDEVSTDWKQWQALLPDGPHEASTEALEEALSLVRGRPFDPVKARRYAWAEQLKQQMIRSIIDTSYELARRRLMDGRWRAADSASTVGLGIEPGYERLWRVRILAAHASGNVDAVQEAVGRLLAVAEDWGGELEAETEELLEQLRADQPLARDALNGHAL